jgi:hypothetical protein
MNEYIQHQKWKQPENKKREDESTLLLLQSNPIQGRRGKNRGVSKTIYIKLNNSHTPTKKRLARFFCRDFSLRRLFFFFRTHKTLSVLMELEMCVIHLLASNSGLRSDGTVAPGRSTHMTRARNITIDSSTATDTYWLLTEVTTISKIFLLI